VRRELTRTRIRLAWAIALGADSLQLVAFPVFGEGFSSPIDDALDVAVGAALVLLLGWHWAFLPTVLAELVPGLDLIPTWTAAVFFATRRGPTTTLPSEAAPALPAGAIVSAEGRGLTAPKV